MSSGKTPRQARGVRLTVLALVVFIGVVIASFVHRIQMPRLMSPTEMKINGLHLLDTPRDIGDFKLVDHRGRPFTPAELAGRWTLLFFGYTSCPDICPTTMAFLARLMEELQGTEAEDTRVVMVTVDPARDTPQRLAGYVPHFNPAFIGVTGEFMDLHRFATALNTPFRKVPGGDADNYLVDHSANVVLINPRGHYHGFFKPPLDLAKVKGTYRSARELWER